MSETERRRRDDQLSDAEFLAQYEAKHGREAMEVVAKAMAMDVPRRKRPPVRAGAKEIKRKAWGNLIPPQGGPTAKELSQAHFTGDLPPERARIIEHAAFAGTCKARDCGEPFAKGEEVVMLYPSHRVVHARCAREAARERCGGSS